MNSILIFNVDLAFSCILFTNCNLIPLFDLAAIAIAIALKRLCEVMREVAALVCNMFFKKFDILFC